MKSNIILPLSRCCRLILITGALVLATQVQVPLARAGGCDNDIPAEQFQDNGWNPKDPKNKDKRKPPHRLVDAKCQGCQKFVDDLQKALDDCYAKQLQEIGNIDYGQDGAKEKQRLKSEAKDALGGKDIKPPKGKTQEDLKDEVKKKWEALKGKLNTCPNAQPGNVPVPPAAPPPGGGGAEPPAGGGSQPQPPGGAAAPAPKPNITIPKVPPCFNSEKEKNDFIGKLETTQADERGKARADRVQATGKKNATDPAEVAARDQLEASAAQHQANVEALQDAIDAADKIPIPCPSPAAPKSMLPPKPGQQYVAPGPAAPPTPMPEEHGRAPVKPGETCAVLVATGNITVETSGTGETIGHVADLKIRNLTDRPLTCRIPPMILESGSGKNQHYACPSGQTVALNPHQAKTVPMNGVCLNRNKPPVGKGVSGDLVMNEANPGGPQYPNSHMPATEAGHLLRTCAGKYAAADQLQKSGALKSLPYRDPQKQKDIVVQWSTWMDPAICQMTGSPPATKEDLRKVVYKQVEEQGPMTPQKKKKVDQGIDTIFEKIELTSAKAKELEPQGPVFTGPVSTEKSGPLFKPAGPLPKPATVAQPGDVVHVEPQSPRDRPGASAAVGAKGHWMVKVKLPSGKIVEVWFETDDKPALQFCNWIKINKTHTDSGGNTVIDDQEKATAPTPTPTPPTAPEPNPPTAPEPIPPTTPEPNPPITPQPQPPQAPGERTEPEKPKDEGAKSTEALEPPFELPDWLKPWWEALKTGTGAVPTDLPGGKDSLGAIIARLNVKIRDEMAKGHDNEAEFYEKLKKRLQGIYNSMSDEK